MPKTVQVKGGVIAASLQVWFTKMRPRRRMRLSEWSRENAYLDDGARFRAFPFQDGIADAFTDPAVTQVSVRKSSRVGYSQIVKNFIGFCMVEAPCRVLIYQPTVNDAEAYSKDDVDKVLEWPSVRRVVRYRSRDKRNTIRSKIFPGGSLKINGTNSAGEFRRITADKVLLEEPDAYPPSPDKEGEPSDLAFKRAETSSAPLRAAGSTPKIAGTSRIDKLFAAGTREYRWVPCPHCGLMQKLIFGDGTGPGLRWAPRERPTHAWYRCEAGCDIEEHEKGGMDEAGEWVAEAPENLPHRSFHIWAAYSQFSGAAWINIARNFLDARHDRNRLVVFVNQVLGEAFEVQGEAPPWRRLYERREMDLQPGVVPRDALVLTGGLDVQKDRIELFVWGWGADRQSWLVDHVVIAGNPFTDEPWAAASQAIQQTWRHELGAEMRLLRVGADTGFATTQVEAWVRDHPGLAVPVKGASSIAAPPFAWSSVREAAQTGGKRKRGLRLGMVGGHTLTLELYGFLGLDAPTAEEAELGVLHPSGFVHLGPLATEEVCKQLVGDQWVEKTGEWRKVHATEALDGWKYARAMCSALGLDRWQRSKWRQVADMLGHEARSEADEEKQAPIAAAPAQPAPPAPRPPPMPARRVGRSTYLNRIGR